MNYHEHLKTEYWQEAARRVKASAGFKCQVCNSPRDLVAHHRTYAHLGDELNHLGDLICLCGRCHTSFHKVEEIGGVRRATVMPDKERVTPPPPQRLQPVRSRKEERREERNMKLRLRHEMKMKQMAVQLARITRPDRLADMDKAVSALYDHEADMPAVFPTVIDAALVNKFTTKAGGITGKTMQALNVPMPLVKRWKDRLIGQTITEKQCRAALVGRECRSTARTLNLVSAP